MKQQSAIPVIMLSSLTNQETTIEALALGARDFCRKTSQSIDDRKRMDR